MLYAADQPKLSPAQQEGVNVRRARMDASDRRDAAAWSRLVADDCIFSEDDGALHTKVQIMEPWKLGRQSGQTGQGQTGARRPAEQPLK
jgi:hypothetical protein